MFKKIAFLLFVIIIVLSLSACTKNSNNNLYSTTPPDYKHEERMRKDYLEFIKDKYNDDNYKVDEIKISKFFGTYNGCDIVYMGSPLQFSDILATVIIAEYTFVFPSTQEVYAYKNSKFYTLKEAYDDDLLTKADIYDIGTKVGINFIEKNPNP